MLGFSMDEVMLTFDVDWAPDFVINFVAEELVSAGVAATWLITHESPAIASLREHPELFELGVHPNFLPGSTHGEDVPSVFHHCMELVPDATTMRTHSLVQSSEILIGALERTTVRCDLSLLLHRTPGLRPTDFYWEGRRLVRIPTYWEDYDEFEMPEPDFSLSNLLTDEPGLKLLNFHPIHVYLNSTGIGTLDAFKKRAADSAVDVAQVANLVQGGRGARSLFEDVVGKLSRTPTRTAAQLAGTWCDRPSDRLLRDTPEA
jgi:hypothetical protein